MPNRLSTLRSGTCCLVVWTTIRSLMPRNKLEVSRTGSSELSSSPPRLSWFQVNGISFHYGSKWWLKMALGTSKAKLLIWAVALPLRQARQCANSWAEHATILHAWSLRLKGTEQKYQISCPNLQYIAAPCLLNTAAGHEMGMGDQRVCFLCNLSHHDALSTERLGGGKPNRAVVFVMARRGCRQEGETGRVPYITDSAF